MLDEVLKKYWHPVEQAKELKDDTPISVIVMG